MAIKDEEYEPPEKDEAHLQQQDPPHLGQKPRQAAKHLPPERREAPRPLEQIDRDGVHADHLEEELMDNLLGKRARVLDSRGTFVILRFPLSWPEMGFRAAREPGVQETDDSSTWSLW